MQKSFRSFAVIATLAFAVVPAVRADQTGCNPHPQMRSAAPSGLMTYFHAMMGFFGGAK